MTAAGNLIKLMRPGHWIKNFFVLAPPIFAGSILLPTVLLKTLVATLCFCLMASAVYCLNDCLDYENDRKHPSKRHRPVASGAVSRATAATLAAVLTLVTLGVGTWINLWLAAILAAYAVLNIGYSLRLKHYSLVDISVIAIGFLLRLGAGAVAAGCDLSAWIVIVTFLLALFLALGKRREDAAIFENTGEKMRNSIDGYTIRFIDSAMSLIGAATIAAYFIYTVTPSPGRIVHSDLFFLTGLPVTVGLMRYLQVCLDTSCGGDHIRLLRRDPIILGSVITYAVIFLTLWIWRG